MPTTRREPIKTPFYIAVANSLGGFWDTFPWIGLVLFSATWAIGLTDAPAIVQAILGIASAIWTPLYWFWLICDVLANRSGWWWILFGILCYPIGLLLYLIMGRD